MQLGGEGGGGELTVGEGRLYSPLLPDQITQALFSS